MLSMNNQLSSFYCSSDH